MRFALLLIAVAATSAIVYFTVYFWGLGRPIHSFEHAFDLKGKPYVMVPWDSDLTLTKVKELAGPKQVTTALWIDVYRDSQGLLRALHGDERPAAQDPVPKEVKREGPPLADLLAKNGDGPYVLNVLSNVMDIDLQVVKEFENYPKAKVLVQSEFDNVMSSIKKAKPMWSYGTSASDRVRWMSFASIGLLPTVTTTSDVLLTPLRVRKLPVLSPEIVNEAHRRHLSVVVGPLHDEKEALEARSLDADGYFVESLAVFLALQLF